MRPTASTRNVADDPESSGGKKRKVPEPAPEPAEEPVAKKAAAGSKKATAAEKAAADAAGPAVAAVIGQAFSTFSLDTIFGGLKISFWHARPCFISKLL